MGEFALDWLDLREPADERARAPELIDRLADWLAARAPRDGAGRLGPVDLLDLGCGSGANLRYLAPRLARLTRRPQRWRCLDRDAALLATLPGRTAAWARSRGLTPRPLDAGLRVEGGGPPWDARVQAFDLAQRAGALSLAPGAVVVASALLDLVSAAWLEDLLRACRHAGAPMLAALTYDGRVAIEPAHPLDGVVVALVDAHQRRDKGLGPALGPAAAGWLARHAHALGFEAALAASDWRLPPDAAALQSALVEGWAGAAIEQAAELPAGPSPASIADWRRSRAGEAAAGRLRILVGHQDALLLPR
jgi:SAM-dependent methyltransferase